jgi:AraC-like DNA-binding protein
MRAPDLDLTNFRIVAEKGSPLAVVRNQEGGGPVTCHYVCGFVGCDGRPFNPLFDALPRMFATRSKAASRDLLSNLVRTALAESEDRKAGSNTMLAKVAELIVLEAVRGHIEQLAPDSPGWLSGLRDRHVGAALRLIHGRPAAPWTLDGIAREIGLSRSGLAERFAHYVGVPPMQYLARWRLQLASQLLHGPGVSVAQAAVEVGYESEAAFRSAFKKYAGIPPGEWRKSRATRAGNNASMNS